MNLAYQHEEVAEDVSHYWGCITDAFNRGENVLPTQLGLSNENYAELIHYLIDNKMIADSNKLKSSSEQIEDKRQLYHQLAQLRLEERDDVVALLLSHANTRLPLYEPMAYILATASLGTQHLWHDLGLPNRPLLGELIASYFPTLHAKNTQNMRWKRFFYKQLCEQGGDYVCRAPSCETCSSFSECFIS